MEHCAHCAVGAAPVAHGETFEAPLAAENLVQEMLVLTAIIAVYLIVSGHYAHGAAFDDGPFKGLEVDFAEGALVQLGVYAAAVGLLVVDGKMLNAYGSTLILAAFGIFQSKGCGEDRVFA